MAGLNVVRITMQVIATLITMVGIGLIVAALLSSGWQIMVEPSVGEVHQHGLWFDYVYSNRFLMAGAPGPAVANGMSGTYYNSPLSAIEVGAYNYAGAYGNGIYGYGDMSGYYGYNIAPGGQWVMSYKSFGTPQYGYGYGYNDITHVALYYQIFALVLMSLTVLVSSVGLMMSYCAGGKPGLAISWAVLLLIALIFGASGLIQFYVTATRLEHRFMYAEARFQQFVGYAYWWAVAGVIGIGFGMIGSIVVAVLASLAARENGKERVERVDLAKDDVWYTRGVSDGVKARPAYEYKVPCPAYEYRARSPADWRLV